MIFFNKQNSVGVTVEVVQTLFTSSSGHKAVALPEIKVCNYITTLVEYSWCGTRGRSILAELFEYKSALQRKTGTTGLLHRTDTKKILVLFLQYNILYI